MTGFSMLTSKLLMSMAILILSFPASAGSVTVGVLTQHNDNFRTGAYLAEHRITTVTLASRSMLLKYHVPVTGGVETQVLYVPRLLMADGKVHDTAFVTTNLNWVYAID